MTISEKTNSLEETYHEEIRILVLPAQLLVCLKILVAERWLKQLNFPPNDHLVWLMRMTTTPFIFTPAIY